MTDDDLDQRLRAVLRDRADRVHPRLSGPELRRAADARRARPGPRRPVAVLASAAAVVGIAAGVAVLARGGDEPRPVPPAGPISTVPTPAATSTPPRVTTPTEASPTGTGPTVTSPSLSNTTAVPAPPRPTRSASDARPGPAGRTTPRAPSTVPATR